MNVNKLNHTRAVENPVGLRAVLPLSLAGIASFQLAYSFRSGSFLIAVYLWCLFQLTRLKTGRQAFYVGLTVGSLAFAPQMNFLWNIFGPAAIALWLVVAFWIALFISLGRACRLYFGKIWAIVVIPFLWTGLEYFRSELYYLRFSWFNAGYVFANNLAWLPIHCVGMYGAGFILMAAICGGELLVKKRSLLANFALLITLAVLTNLPVNRIPQTASTIHDLQIAGVQMEFPSETEVLFNLNHVLKKCPQAKLVVLSEYTFEESVPQRVKDWCRKNERYLIVGGKEPVSSSQYYNTAFVIGTNGDVIFSQAKCVPIQFFKDGLPAREQKLWASPWGKIGICICYDLSYTRVTDGLIRLGAQAIIVPTMDVVDWGRHQHQIHARVAPIRAAEYGVPIFRLASSGISQCVNASGQVESTAPMPGDGEILSGTLRMSDSGSLPWDRMLAPVCVAITGLTIIALTCISICRKWNFSPDSPPP